MADRDLQVILKAEELIEHTIKLTINVNHYPKKLRYTLVDRMQNKSFDIYEYLLDANRTDIRTYKRDRLELQTKAITSCDKLLVYIKISFRLNLISSKSMEYWSKMVTDIKRMTIAWRTKDRER